MICKDICEVVFILIGIDFSIRYYFRKVILEFVGNNYICNLIMNSYCIFFYLVEYFLICCVLCEIGSD